MKKKLSAVLIILILCMTVIVTVKADSLTRRIDSTGDDTFLTDIGAYFDDTALIPMKSTTTYVRSILRFENIVIERGVNINNATLFVRSLWDYGYDGVQIVPIRGIDAANFSEPTDSSAYIFPVTSAVTSWNITDMVGNVEFNATVTDIVQEIINRPDWQSGNPIALYFASTVSTVRRDFVSYDYGAAAQAWFPRLEITFDVLPSAAEENTTQQGAPAPFNDPDVYEWDWWEQYRGFDKYNVTQVGEIWFHMYANDQAAGYEGVYRNTTDIPTDDFVEIDSDQMDTTISAYQKRIEVYNNWTVIALHQMAGVGDESAFIYYSNDWFNTWTEININDVYAHTSAFSGRYPSLMMNETGDMHLVWASVSDFDNANRQVFYTTFRINSTGGLDWEDYENVTMPNQFPAGQIRPDIYVEEDNTVHVAWSGRNGTANTQIQYRRRYPNGTWTNIIIVSETDVDDHSYPSLMANEANSAAMIAWRYENGAGNPTVNWDYIFPNMTDSPDPRTLDADATAPVLATHRDQDLIHVTYQNPSGGNGAIKYRFNQFDNSSWTAEANVSPVGEQHFIPSIGIDEGNYTVYVAWRNTWNTRMSYNTWDIGDNPVAGKIDLTTGVNDLMELVWIQRYLSRRSIGDPQTWIVYPNGTYHPVIVDPDEADDIIDVILGGSHPDDPDTDDWGSYLTRFRFKLLILMTGLVMTLITPIMGFIYRPSLKYWIIILYVMFCGVGVLWSLVSM